MQIKLNQIQKQNVSVWSIDRRPTADGIEYCNFNQSPNGQIRFKSIKKFAERDISY